jgi:hypothetical protein
MLPCLIKYNEVRSNTVHNAFKTALSIGRYGVNDGATAGPGIRCLFNRITNNITTVVMAATKRSINLSLMIFQFEDLII